MKIAADPSRSRGPGAGIPAARRAGGFTLVEILVAIVILALLIGILVIGLQRARRSARISAQTSTVAALKLGTDSFVQAFNTAPPLVKDFAKWPAPVTEADLYLTSGGETRLAVYQLGNTQDRDFLRRAAKPAPPGDWGKTDGPLTDYWDLRYSTASLPTYLIGSTEKAISTTSKTPIDGVPGPGLLRPRADGSFEVPEGLKAGTATSNQRTGEKFGPFVDTGKGSMKLKQNGSRLELVDDKEIAYRYYRWLPGDAQGRVGKPSDMNIPWLIVQMLTPEGDRDFKIDDRNRPANAALNSATFAIVAAGPNGVFGDEKIDVLRARLPEVSGLGDTAAAEETIRRRAYSDNVVEVGK